MFRILIATTLIALAAGCQTKPSNEIIVGVGPDGSYRVASSDTSADGQAVAAILQSALNGELDDSEEAPEALDEDEVWRTDAAGNLTHIQSGAQCPQRWGEYVRGRTSIFQPDGTDVGCSYESATGAVMTFYVYKNPENLVVELDQTFETMKTRQPVSTEAPFGAGTLSPAFVARTLAFEAADGTRIRTSVLLADGGLWRLKVRLTCSANDAVRIETAAGVALMGQADRLASSRPPPPVEKPSPV